MLEAILYLLTGVLTYIACVVWKGEYEDFLGFIAILGFWWAYWIIGALLLIKWGTDIIAYHIMRLIGKR